jgi:hypothetical protein
MMWTVGIEIDPHPTLFQFQMLSLQGKLGPHFEFVFANATHPATGPPDAGVQMMERNGSFLTFFVAPFVFSLVFIPPLPSFLFFLLGMAKGPYYEVSMRVSY